MMAKYCFPAVFTPEDGGYSVDFPDLENCYTCGDSLPDAMAMASDVLALTLTVLEDEKKSIPAPGDVASTPHEPGEFVSLVLADTAAYRRQNSSRSVKKTLTIPEWLNTAAENANLNFSQILQEALTAKLGLR